MFWLIPVLGLLGIGGIGVAIARKRSGGAGGGISSEKLDEFLERRSDGLIQFNRDTGKQILGWLASVSTEPLPPIAEGVRGYALLSSKDGSPPSVDNAASKLLVGDALSGSMVLVHRGITYTGKERRAVSLAPSHPELQKLAGPSGAYAILITPKAEQELKNPELPAMPGFSNESKPVPGMQPMAKKPINAAPGGVLPPALRERVDALLAKPDAKPEELEAVAKQLRLGGYEVDAAVLEKRAADMRAVKVVADAVASSKSASPTFVIPAGHPGAMALAKKLTGDERRYRELLASNPNLAEKMVSGVTYVVPWSPGQVVKIPASWAR